jgi:outer membrane protein TolC
MEDSAFTQEGEPMENTFHNADNSGFGETLQNLLGTFGDVYSSVTAADSAKDAAERAAAAAREDRLFTLRNSAGKLNWQPFAFGGAILLTIVLIISFMRR